MKEIRALAATVNISSGFRDETLVRGVEPKLTIGPALPGRLVRRISASFRPEMGSASGRQTGGAPELTDVPWEYLYDRKMPPLEEY